MAPKAFNLGDPCTRCGGTMRKARIPTDKEFAAAFDREKGLGLPDGYDTMHPDQRAELGPLYVCERCGMAYRFGPQAPAATAAARA